MATPSVSRSARPARRRNKEERSSAFMPTASDAHPAAKTTKLLRLSLGQSRSSGRTRRRGPQVVKCGGGGGSDASIECERVDAQTPARRHRKNKLGCPAPKFHNLRVQVGTRFTRFLSTNPTSVGILFMIETGKIGSPRSVNAGACS